MESQTSKLAKRKRIILEFNIVGLGEKAREREALIQLKSIIKSEKTLLVRSKSAQFNGTTLNELRQKTHGLP